MKKFAVVLIAATAGALAIAPDSALALAGGWAGWSTEHSDNLADPAYYTSFGNNGTGDSRYCVEPNRPQGTHCDSNGAYSPVGTPVVFLAGGQPEGCNRTADQTTANPCTNGDRDATS